MSDHDEQVADIVRAEILARGDDEGLTVTEWVLIAATGGWDSAGDGVSQVIVIPSDAPVHRVWGLVRVADCRFHTLTVDDLTDDEEPADE